MDHVKTKGAVYGSAYPYIERNGNCSAVDKSNIGNALLSSLFSLPFSSR